MPAKTKTERLVSWFVDKPNTSDKCLPQSECSERCKKCIRQGKHPMHDRIGDITFCNGSATDDWDCIHLMRE